MERPSSFEVKPPSETILSVAKAQEQFKATIRTQCPCTGDCYLVIGAGFLGKAVIRALVERGETNVRVFDIAENPGPLPEGVEYFQGNVANPSSLETACFGVDTVYATFAIIRYYQRLAYQAEISRIVNVEGMANVIKACQRAGVRRLIQTSTNNVALGTTFNPKMYMTEDTCYIDEKSAFNHYGWTKAEAEKLVLAANGTQTKGEVALETAAIRPCGIFGPHDNLITEMGIRDNSHTCLFGDTWADYCYVDNIVLGHLLVEAKLIAKTSGVAGESFLITNDEPYTNMHFAQRIQSYRPEMKINEIPSMIIWTLAYIAEGLQWLTRGRILGGFQLTPPTLDVAGTSCISNIEKAKKTLGYTPAFTVDQGILLTVAAYSK